MIVILFQWTYNYYDSFYNLFIKNLVLFPSWKGFLLFINKDFTRLSLILCFVLLDRTKY